MRINPQPAVSSAINNPNTVISPEEAPNWLHQGFVDDDFSHRCQRAQGRSFLYTGVLPAVGHRVELTLFLAASGRRSLPFRLSGEVTRVRSIPAFGQSQPVGAATSLRRVSMNSCESCDQNETTTVWRPSMGPDDFGLGRGSVLLADTMRLALPGLNLMDGWALIPAHAKKTISNMIIERFGALHGQEVVCEGRSALNYYY